MRMLFGIRVGVSINFIHEEFALSVRNHLVFFISAKMIYGTVHAEICLSTR